ncbi:riboflavin synthase [Sebaldella sp. S0638]|uniref:riboflavin synthase n=1 Tax=Sebaldella sp. S0638 TaxID=2957809 RepID=UPI00209D63AB|nr:riboflavin synthase [Sebaldella sp. S0638]
MFTGLIEEIGKISDIKNKSQGLKIKIEADKVIENVNIGDSIAVNGVCLTVTEYSKNSFTADAMYETINRSNLKRLRPGDRVNLEKSLTLSKPLGGHLVTGDVECEGEIMSVEVNGIARHYKIKMDKKYMKYVVEKGRITLDGASLTVIDAENDTFSVSLIPHTIENIILGSKKSGDLVNIETDLFAKYVEKILNSEKETGLTQEFLSKNGF